MRRFFLVLFIAAVALVGPSVAQAQDVLTEGWGRVGQDTFFAFRATQGPQGSQGRMHLFVAPNELHSATVRCVSALETPNGGGIATIVGELDEPAFGVFPTMIFEVTDSGRSGSHDDDDHEGGGDHKGDDDEDGHSGGDDAADMWTGQFSPLPPELNPCGATAGQVPIDDGEIIVRVS